MKSEESEEPDKRLAALSVHCSCQLHSATYFIHLFYPVSFSIGSFHHAPHHPRGGLGRKLEYAGLTGNETVWDLYCGIGTISLFLAQKAKFVRGVEIVPQAIDNARENAKLNGIENVGFLSEKQRKCCRESMRRMAFMQTLSW